MTQLSIIDGEYRTVPRKVSWFARQFPSVAFFCRLAGIVWRSSREARRGHYGDQEWLDSSLEVLRALEGVGVEFEVTGLHHLERLDTPYLVVGNHMGTLETTILPGLIRPYHEVTFVVKKSLLEYPVFKHVMRSRDPIAVSQTDPRADFRAMMAGGEERLANGISLIIFPEGERRSKFDPEAFNTVGVKLGRRAGVPIVPLALETSAWGIGKWIPDIGKIDPSRKVRFAFGEPLEVEDRGTLQQEAIVQFIIDKLATWSEDRQPCLQPTESHAKPIAPTQSA